MDFVTVEKNRKIHKFVLEITDFQDVEIQKDFKIISVINQNGKLCLYAIVDPNGKKVAVKIRIVGTGHPFIANSLNFIETVQVGDFIWHVFENISAAPGR